MEKGLILMKIPVLYTTHNRLYYVKKTLEPLLESVKGIGEVHIIDNNSKDGTVDYLKSIAPPNVTFTGWVDEDQWLNYYAQASVYVQASAHEGFGMSVAEAMSAGCIPVVASVGSLPEVVGDSGVKVNSMDPAVWAKAVEQALQFPVEERRSARHRILSSSPLEKRGQALVSLIENLTR